MKTKDNSSVSFLDHFTKPTKFQKSIRVQKAIINLPFCIFNDILAPDEKLSIEYQGEYKNINDKYNLNVFTNQIKKKYKFFKFPCV